MQRAVEKLNAEKTDAVVFGVSMNIISDENGAIISQTDFIPNPETYICEDYEQIVNGPLRYMIGTPYEEMENVLYHDRYKYMKFAWVYCWLYRTDIIERYNVRFREDLNLREDGIFNCEYLMHVSSINCIPIVGYEYNKRSDGAASTLTQKADVQTKIALVRYRSLIEDFVYDRSKIDISKWSYGSYILSILQLSVALSDERGGYKKLKSYLRLEEIKKAIKGAPLKGSKKIVIPLFFAKIKCARLMFFGIKLFKKIIKI